MRYLRYLLMLAAVAFSLNAPAHADESAVRERISFNADWRFIKGEPPGAVGDAAFDDSRWRKLDLPHDFGIEGPFKHCLLYTSPSPRD